MPTRKVKNKMATTTVNTATMIASPLREDEHALESVLSKQHRPSQAKLRALGYLSLEQLIGAAPVARHELSAYLGIPLDQLLASTPMAATAVPANAASAIENAEYPLGVTLELIPMESMHPMAALDVSLAPPVPPAGPTPSVNLIGPIPPIRDQGTRGTCVAFAAVGLLEQYLNRAGAYQEMSEQFLYWDCKQNDGHPTTPGTWLGIAVPLLKRDGCCTANTWPYVPNPFPGNEGQGPPPVKARVEALTYRIPVSRQLPATSIADLKAELSVGCWVAFSIPVFNSWYRNQWVAYTGDIINPVPGEVRVGGHAMCLVGWVDLPDNPELGGGRFLLRNSWDAKWGINCPYGTGYGTIPYRYIASYCMEAYSIAGAGAAADDSRNQ